MKNIVFVYPAYPAIFTLCTSLYRIFTASTRGFIMFQFAISAVIALIMAGCSGPRYIDYFPYHDDGTPKPKVAVMPILDSSYEVFKARYTGTQDCLGEEDVSWEGPAYSRSYCGRGYRRVISCLAKRLEEVIRSAK